MKLLYTEFINVLFFITCQLPAQTIVDYCAGAPRYDTEVFSALAITPDVTYGANLNYQNVNTILKMDIYQPAGDTASIRPLIIFAHGGSFIAGDKGNSDQVDLCTHFAKRGYVTATINYRLGFFPIDSVNATRAVYRAVQDMKAAVRFFRKDAATTNVYKIDPDVIFVGGSSAGAFTALHLAYLDQYAELPASIDTAMLGSIEGNSGNPGYASTANAVINLCGALGKKSWMHPGDIPVVSMHGTADNVVPYNTQMLYILTFYPIMVVDGSYSINRHADSIGVSNAMYTWFGAQHVPYDGGTVSNQAYLDTTLRFVSNFLYSYLGCTPSNPNPLPNTFNAPIGLSEISMATDISLYPNPTHEELNIRLRDHANEIVIRSVEGKEVYHARALKSNHFNIPVQLFSRGMYLVEVTTEGKVIVGKVMIE